MRLGMWREYVISDFGFVSWMPYIILTYDFQFLTIFSYILITNPLGWWGGVKSYRVHMIENDLYNKKICVWFCPCSSVYIHDLWTRPEKIHPNYLKVSPSQIGPSVLVWFRCGFGLIEENRIAYKNKRVKMTLDGWHWTNCSGKVQG